MVLKERWGLTKGEKSSLSDLRSKNVKDFGSCAKARLASRPAKLTMRSVGQNIYNFYCPRCEREIGMMTGTYVVSKRPEDVKSSMAITKIRKLKDDDLVTRI